MFRKCVNCNERKPLVYENRIPTMAGDVVLRYCHDCNNERIVRERKSEEAREKLRQLERDERRKQNRYEFLKREVELRELEKRAEELGIKYE